MSADLDVKAVRAELGLSQAAFAEQLGVDQSTVSGWECEKFSPGGPAVRIIASLIDDHRARHSHKGRASA